MNKKLLNKKEQKEITDDVKNAFDKAKKISEKSHDKVLNQKEVDTIISGNNLKIGEKKLTIFISILIIVLISCCLLYWYLSNNPRTIFLKSINSVFQVVDNNLMNSYDISKGTISLNIDGTLTKANYVKNNNNQFIKATISKNKFYGQKENSYLYDGNYIKLNNANFYYSKDNAHTILKSLNEGTNSAIKGQKYTIDKTDISINNKKTSITVAILELNKNNLNNVVESLITYFKNDEDFIQNYQKITGKTDISDFLTNINKINNYEQAIIKIYTTFNYEFAKLEITLSQANENETMSLMLDNSGYNYTYNSTNLSVDGNIKIDGKLENDFTVIQNGISSQRVFKIYKEKSIDKVKVVDIKQEKSSNDSNKDYENLIGKSWSLGLSSIIQ